MGWRATRPSSGQRAASGLDVCATLGRNLSSSSGSGIERPEVAESDAQGHGRSQLMRMLPPRAQPAARGKSFNRGLVYLSRLSSGG